MDENILEHELIEDKEDLLSQEEKKQKKNSLKDLKGPFYRGKILHTSETGIFTFNDGTAAEINSYIIVTAKYGKDLAVILGEVHCVHCLEQEEINIIDRKASEEDYHLYKKNQDKEHKAMQICKEKIVENNLDMKLVSVHYLQEEAKILFFFTADTRVDFRELVKDLVSVFKMRIELRQIGVRDESRVIGGAGVCGRVLCCHGVSDQLRPVSIKMAKEQNLSLNSMKISGPCGRLLCCLSYEYDVYHEIKDKLPREGAKIVVDNDIFRLNELNILSKRVLMSHDDGRIAECKLEDLFYDEGRREWLVRRK